MATQTQTPPSPSRVMSLCASHSPGFARDDEEKFGDVFRQGLWRAKEMVAAFEPTLVVFFGSDHRRAFTDTVPAISVVTGAEGLGDLLSPTGPYDVPKQLAEQLATHLLDSGFDVAVTREVKLDHGFGQTAADLLGSIDAVPLVPIFINCATAPIAGPARSTELGEAVRTFLDTLTDERVLVLGSGGLSHNPPTLALISDIVSEEERKAVSLAHREAAKDMIRPDWDEAFLADLGRADADGAADMAWAHTISQESVDQAGAGANEVRTWLAAYAAAGLPMTKVAYEPVREWITGMGIAVSTPHLAAVAATAGQEATA